MSPTAIAEDVTLNVHQAAAQCRVSRRVIYYWMQHGKLPFTVVRGSRRVTYADVLRVRQGSWAGKKRE